MTLRGAWLALTGSLVAAATLAAPVVGQDAPEEAQWCSFFEQPCWTHMFLCYNVGLYQDQFCCPWPPCQEPELLRAR